MPRLITLLVIALPLLTSEAASPARHFRLRAKVLGVGPASSTTPRECILTAFDAGFVVTARVISATPADARFLPRHTVTFAIHSPSQLFMGEEPRGRTYEFDLRPPKARSSIWYLEIVRERPNHAIQRTAGCPRV